MTRGIPLRLILVALGLLVGGVVVLAIREHLPPAVVRLVALADLVAIGVLVALAWWKRRGSRDVPL